MKLRNNELEADNLQLIINRKEEDYLTNQIQVRSDRVVTEESLKQLSKTTEALKGRISQKNVQMIELTEKNEELSYRSSIVRRETLLTERGQPLGHKEVTRTERTPKNSNQPVGGSSRIAHSGIKANRFSDNFKQQRVSSHFLSKLKEFKGVEKSNGLLSLVSGRGSGHDSKNLQERMKILEMTMNYDLNSNA